MAAITVSNITKEPVGPDTADVIKIECDFNVVPDLAHVQIEDAATEMMLDGAGLHGTGRIKAWDIGEVFECPVRIIAVNGTDGILDETTTITILFTDDKINQIRNVIYEKLRDAAGGSGPFKNFRIYKWGDPIQNRFGPYIELTLEAGQASEHLVGRDRIQFMNFTFDLVFKRSYRKKIGEGEAKGLEKDELAQWYLGKLEEVLNSIKWDKLDIVLKRFLGETHHEPADIAQNWLFGAVSSLLLGFKTN